MRKVLLSSLGLLGLAAVGTPAASGAEVQVAPGIIAMTSSEPSQVQAAPAVVDRGTAAEDDSAARRRRRRRGGTRHQ
ncbi:MAG: hypothetical protein IRZ13_02900 [Acetobacteraceae bacterium]|nr:hypothetical protein [Acetobacteraceae bacterium]